MRERKIILSKGSSRCNNTPAVFIFLLRRYLMSNKAAIIINTLNTLKYVWIFVLVAHSCIRCFFFYLFILISRKIVPFLKQSSRAFFHAYLCTRWSCFYTYISLMPNALQSCCNYCFILKSLIFKENCTLV